MPTKWHCWFWEPVRNCARNALTRSLVARMIGLDKSRHGRGHGRCRRNGVVEVRDCNENWYEGGHGRCRQNDIVKFGITHAPST